MKDCKKEVLKDRLNRIENAIIWNRSEIARSGGRNKYHERNVLNLNAKAYKIELELNLIK